MAIDFGLGLRALQTFGEDAQRSQEMQAQQQVMQQRGYAFQQQQAQDRARIGIGQQVRAGDYAGAQQQATLGGDFDFAKAIGGLQDAHVEQLQRELDAIGTLHPQLKALPVEARAAAAIPVLKQAGFSDAELAGVNWTDAGLDNAYAMSKAGQVALAARMKAAEPYTLAPGSRRYSGAQVLAENPAEPKYQSVPEGGMLVRVDGGSATPVYGAPSAAGGSPAPSAPGGRYQYGWTPRQRNGGDNSDAAVDSKISGMSQALGISPDADLTGMDPMKIARALALSEGGAGSLADRNNNPGNLRDPKTGAYRQFADKNAGLQAAASQVRRNIARGQTSIRTMVEGLPVGGQQQAAAPGAPGVIMGRPKQANAPSGYQFGPDGRTLQPIPGGPADPQTATTRTVQSNRKAEGDLRQKFDAEKEVQAFKTARTQFYTIRDLANKKNPTAQDDIALVYAFMKTLDPTSVVREGEFATAQNAGGLGDNARNLVNKVISGQRLNPEQRQNMTRAAYASYNQFRAAYNTTAERYQGYARDYGLTPQHVAARAIIDQPKGNSAPSALGMGQSTQIGGFKVTRIK